MKNIIIIATICGAFHLQATIDRFNDGVVNGLTKMNHRIECLITHLSDPNADTVFANYEKGNDLAGATSEIKNLYPSNPCVTKYFQTLLCVRALNRYLKETTAGYHIATSEESEHFLTDLRTTLDLATQETTSRYNQLKAAIDEAKPTVAAYLEQLCTDPEMFTDIAPETTVTTPSQEASTNTTLDDASEQKQTK